MQILQHDYTGIREVAKYEHVIVRKCLGVLITRRGENDPHVVLQPIIEDDKTWHTPSGGFSSFWLPEYIDVLNEARTWIQMNCDSDPSGYGWKFRS